MTVAPTPVTVAPRPTVPTFFSSGQWRAWVPAGDSVLSATPYDTTPFMRWDVAANLDFNVPGGYFLGPAPLQPGQTTPVGQFGPQWRNTMLVLGSVGNNTWSLPADASSYQAQAITDLKYWKTAIIVLTADQPYAAAVEGGDRHPAGLRRPGGRRRLAVGHAPDPEPLTPSRPWPADHWWAAA